MTQPRNYSELLQKLGELREQLTGAFQQRNYQKALDVSETIGALYFPDDMILARKISHLTYSIAGDMYYAGAISSIGERQ